MTVGGQFVFHGNLFYTHENFIEQVHVAEQLTPKYFGVSTGLTNEGCGKHWEWSRFIFLR